MKFRHFYFGFLILFSGLSFAQANKDFEHQCKLIRTHISNPKKNIHDVRTYTFKQLSNDEDFIAVQPYFKDIEVLEKTSLVAEKIPDFEDLSPVQKMLLFAYGEMMSLPFQEKPLHHQIRRTGQLCSLMLTKELASPEAIEELKEHPYPLIRGTASAIQEIMTPAVVEMREEVKRKFHSDLTIDNSEDLLLPFVFIPPNTAYQQKTFIYALTQGVSLFGLGHDPFPGHGGVFRSPFLAFTHDGGHESELLDKQTGQTQGKLSLAILKQFSETLLEKLEDLKIFTNKEERKVAIHAAFVMLHETQIKTYTNSFFSSKPMEERVRELFTAKKHQFGYSEFKKYPEDFTRRFFSDLARELIALKPDLKEAIYGDNDPKTQPLSYKLESVIEEEVNLISWLEQKMYPKKDSFWQ